MRFATFSRAAALIAGGQAGLKWRPDLLHLNDWPCALAAAYLKWNGATARSLLTNHNLKKAGTETAKVGNEATNTLHANILMASRVAEVL